MKILKKNKELQPGFSLMEVMVSLAIIMILISGVYELIMLSLRITEENKFAVEAINIANQRMEKIRNMPYNQVGTVGGVIPGTLQPVETVERSGTFLVYTYIIFQDDPYDGQIGSTTPDINSCGTDYKIVTIKVVWQGKYGEKNIKVFSKIIPKNIEANDGYGTMKITINDIDGLPVPGADLHIYKVLTSTTTIDASYPIGDTGVLYLPVPAANGYKLTVSKAGYETVYTHEATTTNPNPIPQDWNVSEGALVEDNIEINKLVNLDINTVSQSQPDNWKANTTITPSASTNPRAAIDGSDKMYAVWQREDISSSTLYIQKFDSTGNKEWAQDLKILDSAHYQTNPDITTINDGTSYVVWQDTSSSLKSTTPLVKIPNLGNWQIASTKEKNHFQNNFFEKGINFPIFYSDFLKGINTFVYAIKNIVNRKNANAAGNIVQTKIGSNTYVGSSMSTTFDNPPTSGNVIIAIAVHRNSNDSFSVPTNANGNFSVSAYSNSAWSLDVGIWYKVAGVGEDSTVIINSTGAINGGVLMIMEVSGLDAVDLIDVIKINDQTGGTGVTATTGNSPISTANGFAIAAIAFADDDFNVPNSTSWTSGSSDSYSHYLWREWGASTNDGSLAVATMNINTASLQNASLTLSGGGSEERNSVLAVFNNFTYAQAASADTQIATINAPAVNQYIGGKFIITNIGSARDVTGVTISENGSIDAQNNLENIKLFYDLDTSAPYDCASENYAGTEGQFGATSAFTSANGTASFIDSINISTIKSLCLYTVLDIKDSVSANDTLEIYIENPTTDVIISTGGTIPNTPIALSGTTDIFAPAKIVQSHYRFRKNDESEALASNYGPQNSNISINANEEVRVRFEIFNSGNLNSGVFNYQLEYAKKTLDCAIIPEIDWSAIPNDNSKHWRMNDSTHITNGDVTTNVSDVLTDEKTNFIPGHIMDENSLSGNINLGYDEFSEIEYSILATANIEDIEYCLRLTNSGAPDLEYTNSYPVITIIGDNNIYIAKISSLGIVNSIKRINSDAGNSEQNFPRIATTENFGEATTSVVWQDKRNGNYDIFLQILDNDSVKQIASEIQITSSSTDEYSPLVAIDTNDNIIIAWLENDLSHQNLYIQKYDLLGNPLWVNAQKIVSTSLDYYYPEIAVDNSGNFFLVWTDNTGGILNSYLGKWNAAGTNVWQVATNKDIVASNRQKPFLAVTPTDIYAVWTDSRENNNDIYAQKFDSSGAYVWSNDQRINISTDTELQDNAVLVTDSTGTPFGFWQDLRSGRAEIYATQFNDPGAITPLPNIDINISWEKLIGIDTYETNATTTVSDASGHAHLTIGYSIQGCVININEAGKTVILRSPADSPLFILPGESQNVLLYVE